MRRGEIEQLCSVDTLHIDTPSEFKFEHTLAFLRRSPKELLHRVDGDRVVKAIEVNGKTVVFQLEEAGDKLLVTSRNGILSGTDKTSIMTYIREWFDLDTNLEPFYRLAKQDALLKPLVKSYHGYRIVGQPDLFESLVWAVLGQQINLAFAYTLKGRFVTEFGKQVVLEGVPHFIFPSPEVVSEIKPEQLLALQFSRQKAAYTINIAKAFLQGEVSKEKLQGLTIEEAKQVLRTIKGVGNWTANYALMKTFRYPDAFPLEDAGLHNALKQQLKLKSKPSLEQVKKIFKKYKGWEAYATLYLWKSL